MAVTMRLMEIVPQLRHQLIEALKPETPLGHGKDQEINNAILSVFGQGEHKRGRRRLAALALYELEQWDSDVTDPHK